jgi:hypothetical protein
MNVSASVPFSKHALRVLYALANSNCSAPLSLSTAWNDSAVWFADLEVHHNAPACELPDERQPTAAIFGSHCAF